MKKQAAVILLTAVMGISAAACGTPAQKQTSAAGTSVSASQTSAAESSASASAAESSSEAPGTSDAEVIGELGDFGSKERTSDGYVRNQGVVFRVGETDGYYTNIDCSYGKMAFSALIPRDLGNLVGLEKEEDGFTAVCFFNTEEDADNTRKFSVGWDKDEAVKKALADNSDEEYIKAAGSQLVSGTSVETVQGENGTEKTGAFMYGSKAVITARTWVDQSTGYVIYARYIEPLTEYSKTRSEKTVMSVKKTGDAEVGSENINQTGISKDTADKFGLGSATMDVQGVAVSDLGNGSLTATGSGISADDAKKAAEEFSSGVTLYTDSSLKTETKFSDFGKTGFVGYYKNGDTVYQMEINYIADSQFFAASVAESYD